MIDCNNDDDGHDGGSDVQHVISVITIVHMISLSCIDAKVYSDISIYNQNTIIDIVKPTHKNHHIKNIRSHHNHHNHLQSQHSTTTTSTITNNNNNNNNNNNLFPILSVNELFIQSSVLINVGPSVNIG